MKTVKYFSAFLIALLLITCKGDDKSFNVFTISQDVELGKQVVAEIESDSSEYDVLQPDDFPAAYEHLQRIIDTILNSGKVKYKEEFEWRTRIIYDDEVLNAFCAPGGYIYVFTGLIKYLDSEDQLAGVLGHEIAHADRRHSTDQLTKQYGIDLVSDAILGDSSAVATIASGLLLLKYSRDNEEEADEYSVRYLCPTIYNAAGAAGFFEKIEASGGSSTPEFLSTHPNPENRVEAIYDRKKKLNCDGKELNIYTYQDFKNSLPY